MSYKNELDGTLQVILETFQDQQRQMNEQFELLRKRQQETDEKLKALANNDNVAVRPAHSAIQQGEINAAETEINTSSESIALLPIFSAVAKNHIERIDRFEKKRAVKADKLERNKEKLDDYHEKIEKLKDINAMLDKSSEYLPFPTPAFLTNLYKKVCDKNNERIEKIQNEKIPKTEKKIKNHEAAVSSLDNKIELTQCKLDRCTALSGVIKSFAILNPSERKAVFSTSISNLHDATCKLNENKILRANDKLDRLCEAYDLAETHTEKYDIKSKQDKLYEKIKKLNKQSKAIQDAGISPENISEATITKTEAAVQKAAAENPGVGNIADAAVKATTQQDNGAGRTANKEAKKPLDMTNNNTRRR